jgi:glycosyltransferase involved in cell wall biosynthesis
MYSGNLNISHGILDLLDSFAMIKDENFRLWFSGYGNGLKEIMKAAEIDRRIEYWPKLKQIEVFKMQQKATILINPLKSSHVKTKFFFPSKTIEYMASGTPTLMYNLPCIPREYHEYLYFIEDLTIEGIRNKIIEVCNKSPLELNDFGMKAKEFILKNKNSKIQCKKIHIMLEELYN